LDPFDVFHSRHDWSIGSIALNLDMLFLAYNYCNFNLRRSLQLPQITLSLVSWVVIFSRMKSGLSDNEWEADLLLILYPEDAILNGKTLVFLQSHAMTVWLPFHNLISFFCCCISHGSVLRCCEGVQCLPLTRQCRSPCRDQWHEEEWWSWCDPVGSQRLQQVFEVRQPKRQFEVFSIHRSLNLRGATFALLFRTVFLARDQIKEST